MRIYYKLTIGFILVSILVGLQAYIGFVGAISVQNQYIQVVDQTLPVLENLNTMKTAGGNIISATEEILKTSPEDVYYVAVEENEIAEKSEEFERSFEIYKVNINTYFPDETEYMENINKSMKNIRQLSSELVYLKKIGTNESQLKEKELEFAKLKNEFFKITENALENERFLLEERKENTENDMNNLKNNSMIFGIFSMLIGLTLGFFLSSSISKPLNKLKNASYEIGKGNLDTKIEIDTRDEIQDLADTFKIMAINIKNAAAEQKILTDKITKSLEEKEVLLREIHHRVKNNMQIVSSLLMLQSLNIEDKKYRDIFLDSQNRIQAMALIHQKIYQSESLAQINLKEYIEGIVSIIFESYGQKRNIKLEINMETILINIDYAVPCGLIINELVTNSFKYAFPDGRVGIIKIIAKSNDNNMINLSISDDGIGIAKELDIRKTESLGLKLVTSLTESQLHGEIILNREKGTEFKINFRQAK